MREQCAPAPRADADVDSDSSAGGDNFDNHRHRWHRHETLNGVLLPRGGGPHQLRAHPVFAKRFHCIAGPVELKLLLGHFVRGANQPRLAAKIPMLVDCLKSEAWMHGCQKSWGVRGGEVCGLWTHQKISVSSAEVQRGLGGFQRFAGAIRVNASQQCFPLHSFVEWMWTGLWRQAAVQSGAGCSRPHGLLHRGHPAKLACARVLRAALSACSQRPGRQWPGALSRLRRAASWLSLPSRRSCAAQLAGSGPGLWLSGSSGTGPGPRAWICQRAGAAQDSPPGHAELPTSTQLNRPGLELFGRLSLRLLAAVGLRHC